MNEKKDRFNSKRASMSMPDNSDDYREVASRKTRRLKIDTDSYRPFKTRQQLYNELKQDEENLDKDVFEYAPYFDRAAALTLDFIFIYILYKIVIFIAPYEFKLIQYFLNSYKLEFLLGNAFLLNTILAFTGSFVAFIGVIIPTAFFNNSFGKKFFKLKVRGIDKYTISIDEAIAREIFCKPLSILCMAGFILPFYDKEKKSLHDRIMKTIVIKD